MKIEKKKSGWIIQIQKKKIYEGIALIFFCTVTGLRSVQKSPVYQAEKENAYQKGKGFSMESNQRKGSYQEADRGETKVNITLFTFMAKLMQSQR